MNSLGILLLVHDILLALTGVRLHLLEGHDRLILNLGLLNHRKKIRSKGEKERAWRDMNETKQKGKRKGGGEKGGRRTEERENSQPRDPRLPCRVQTL